MYKTLAILLLFLGTVYQIDSKEQSNRWQKEITNTSYQNDYQATFIINENILTVDMKKCQKFDTRCTWQRVRTWIGIALDELHARKTTGENTASISGLQCTLTYSVYTKNPEKLLFQCQNDISTTIHYIKLEEFLNKKFE